MTGSFSSTSGAMCSSWSRNMTRTRISWALSGGSRRRLLCSRTSSCSLLSVCIPLTIRRWRYVRWRTGRRWRGQRRRRTPSQMSSFTRNSSKSFSIRANSSRRTCAPPSRRSSSRCICSPSTASRGTGSSARRRLCAGSTRSGA